MIQRVLAAFAFIAVIVVFWLVLDRQQSVIVPTAQRAGPPPANPGYSATDAEIIQTGADGRHLYTLKADTIHQLPDDEFTLERVRLEVKDDAGNPWEATAAQGEILQDASIVDFIGDVVIAGLLPGSDQPAHITTGRLTLDTRTYDATTRDVVHFEWAGHRMRTHGLWTNLKDHHLRLESDVHGSFQP